MKKPRLSCEAGAGCLVLGATCFDLIDVPSEGRIEVVLLGLFGNSLLKPPFEEFEVCFSGFSVHCKAPGLLLCVPWMPGA